MKAFQNDNMVKILVLLTRAALPSSCANASDNLHQALFFIRTFADLRVPSIKDNIDTINNIV